jgi:uncharacterized protein (DUF1778 family)/GNAT superfamily N-acetyltransferase
MKSSYLSPSLSAMLALFISASLLTTV